MNVIDLSKLVGVKNVENNVVQAQCPCCFNDNGQDIQHQNHLRVYLDTLKFNCVVDQSTFHNKRILELVGTEVDSLPVIIREPKIQQNIIYPKELLTKLVKDHSYWNNRGIPSEVVEPFGGGMAITVGKLQGRYVFPCYNEKNEIVMLTGRWTGEDYNSMRWKHLGNKGSIHLFPHFAREDITKSKKILLLEGPGDVLATRTHQINIGTSLFGLNISSKLMKFLIETNLNHIIISTNNDIDKNSAGNKAAEDMKKKLLNFFDEKRIHIMLPKAKDWGESSESDILTFKDQIGNLS